VNARTGVLGRARQDQGTDGARPLVKLPPTWPANARGPPSTRSNLPAAQARVASGGQHGQPGSIRASRAAHGVPWLPQRLPGGVPRSGVGWRLQRQSTRWLPRRQPRARGAAYGWTFTGGPAATQCACRVHARRLVPVCDAGGVRAGVAAGLPPARGLDKPCCCAIWQRHADAAVWTVRARI
jgi:hypothetical protein